MSERVLIVGQAAPEHVGAAFLSAARSAAIDATLADSTAAWAGGKLRQRLSFRLLGKRPTALGTFSRRVVELCREVRPSVLLSTGVAPVTHDALRAIGKLGVRRINYLTDDPWNPATGARYFWKSLREYDTIYSPRHANMNDLRAHGCGDVRFMPWAYNPELHFPETAQNDAERARYACDVAFVGGGDAGRVELVRP
ncbi:MAG TPA: DUF3880 domain-containing protein, partial [Polyangiales bacterium]|nr:DUF3880 domain-containing protein [Polyangiales bacterium]